MGSSISTSRLTVVSILLFVSFRAFSQGDIQTQYEQFYKSASTWEEYKMIKKPGLSNFWLIVTDTLNARQGQIDESLVEIEKLNERITVLANQLNESQQSLAVSNELNDSIAFVGIQLGKGFYNTVVWSIIEDI